MNIYERLANGKVCDYIGVGGLYFNVADVLIVLGCIIVGMFIIFPNSFISRKTV